MSLGLHGEKYEHVSKAQDKASTFEGLFMMKLNLPDVTTKNSNNEVFDEFSDESNYNKDPDYYDA